MKLVYIAGKLTHPNPEAVAHFRHQAVVAGHVVERMGSYVAFVPHVGILEPNGTPREVWKACMRKCIAMLRRCDYLVPLENWTESRGARVEVWLCKRRSGFPRLVTFEQLASGEGLDGIAS